MLSLWLLRPVLVSQLQWVKRVEVYRAVRSLYEASSSSHLQNGNLGSMTVYLYLNMPGSEPTFRLNAVYHRRKKYGELIASATPNKS